MTPFSKDKDVKDHRHDAGNTGRQRHHASRLSPFDRAQGESSCREGKHAAAYVLPAQTQIRRIDIQAACLSVTDDEIPGDKSQKRGDRSDDEPVAQASPGKREGGKGREDATDHAIDEDVASLKQQGVLLWRAARRADSLLLADYFLAR